MCNNLNVMISIGNDGFFHCREINTEPLESSPVSSFCLNNDVSLERSRGEYVTCIKINSLSIVVDDSSKAIIAIGTACGKVMLSKIVRSEGNLTASLLTNYAVELEKTCVIHALECFRSDGRYTILIKVAKDSQFWNIKLDEMNNFHQYVVSLA